MAPKRVTSGGAGSGSIPFVRGFKRLSLSQAADAVLSRDEKDVNDLPEWCRAVPAACFQPVPAPTSIDDWLAQYHEPEQAFETFCCETPWLSARPLRAFKSKFVPPPSRAAGKRGGGGSASSDVLNRTILQSYPNGRIYLLPIGDFNATDGGAPPFDKLVEYAQIFLGLPISILPPVKLQEVPGARKNHPPRWQWIATGASSADDAGAAADADADADADPDADADAKADADGSEPPARKSRVGRPPARARGASKHKAAATAAASDETAASSSAKGVYLSGRKDAASGARQLRVDVLLNTLVTVRPTDAICLVGLTMEDLYDTDPDLFVAGMARGSARVAVFSFKRYDPLLRFSKENWWDQWAARQPNGTTAGHVQPHDSDADDSERDAGRRTNSGRNKPAGKQSKAVAAAANGSANGSANGAKGSGASAIRNALLLQRSCRLLVHEIGHLLGIGHCVHYRCAMNGSGHLSEDFAQPMHLCPVDLRKLHRLCGFDVEARYRKLETFYSREQLPEDAAWVRARLNGLRVASGSGADAPSTASASAATASADGDADMDGDAVKSGGSSVTASASASGKSSGSAGAKRRRGDQKTKKPPPSLPGVSDRESPRPPPPPKSQQKQEIKSDGSKRIRRT